MGIWEEKYTCSKSIASNTKYTKDDKIWYEKIDKILNIPFMVRKLLVIVKFIIIICGNNLRQLCFLNYMICTKSGLGRIMDWALKVGIKQVSILKIPWSPTITEA